MTETTTRKFTVKETAQEIRKALRAAFPGIKFSLRMSRGTGYGWMDLSWVDGPTVQEVNAVTAGFRSSYFDGRDDSTRHIPSNYSCDGVNTHREYSREATGWAAAMVAAHPGRWERPSDWNPAQYAGWRVLDGTNLVDGYPDAVSDKVW